MNKVILIFFGIQLWLLPNIYAQNYTQPLDENVFIDSSFLKIKLNGSELNELKKLFPNIDTKKIGHLFTPSGDIYILCLLLNKKDKINFIIDRINKREIIKFIEVTELRNLNKIGKNCDKVDLKEKAITSKGIFIGMSIRQFSEITAKIVFNQIYKHKDYWVFEYVIAENDERQSRKQEGMDLRPFQSEIFQHPDMLCSFGVYNKVFPNSHYVARYIFYGHDFNGYNLVKYSFGFQYELPVNPFEGLLYE